MGNVNKYFGAFSEVHKCIKLHDFHNLKFYDIAIASQKLFW